MVETSQEWRTCSRCKLTKFASEFAYRKKAEGKRHSYCLACGRLLARNHYANNVSYYVVKARNRREEFVNDYIDRLLDYLSSHPCVDCGESDPIVLEFDHVRGEKAYNVSVMARLMLSWGKVSGEIAKCKVRCANCHRRKTAERAGSYRYRKSKGPLAQSG
jgi:hypothetical protein